MPECVARYSSYRKHTNSETLASVQEKPIVTPKPEVNVDRQLKDAYQVLVTLSKLSMRSVPMPEGYLI